jgi:four helix bundle protein
MLNELSIEHFVCIHMEQTKLTSSGKPFDIHERLLLFACDIVKVTQFLHTRGAIGRALSYQILAAGTSVGSNAEEADGASSHDDFIAKNRIALKEAKDAVSAPRLPTNRTAFPRVRSNRPGIR